MKRFEVRIRWRGYRWTLQAIARSSADIVSGLIGYFGTGVYICVKAL